MTAALSVLHAHSGNLYGGVETILVALARHPGPLRHRFALAYEDRLAGHLRGVAAPVEILGPVRFSRPWTVAAARRRLASVLERQRPDVMVCHSPWCLAAFGPVARQRQVPLVLWAHQAFTGRHWVERLARWSGAPDFAVCASEYARATIPNLFPGTPADVVYAPVEPPPSFEPSRRPAKRQGHGAGDDTVVISMAARLEPGKGHTVLLGALAAMRDVPGWTAWIVGGAQRRAEDIYRSDLERRTSDARIADRVHFLGQRDDVASLLWASDVYCQPNTGPDTFSISFIEAMYAGLPVVTTRLGGAAEAVTDACGILVPPHQPVAVRDALYRLIRDAELRRSLGAAARERARSLCAPEAAIARLAETLARVVGRRGTGNGEGGRGT